MQYTDMGIDISAANVITCLQDKGVVRTEPSAAICDKNTGNVLVTGWNCFALGVVVGDSQVLISPLTPETWSNRDIGAQLMNSFIYKTLGKDALCKLRIAVCLPVDYSQADREAVKDAAFAAGAVDVAVIDEPTATCIGIGDNNALNKSNIIVNIEGSATHLALVSHGNLVASDVIEVAVDDFDRAIIQYMKKKHLTVIEDTAAETIRMKVGYTNSDNDLAHFDVHGRHLVTGLPKTVSVSASEIAETLRRPAEKLAAGILSCYDQLASEFPANIADSRIVLTGAGVFHGLDQCVSDLTGIDTVIPDDPIAAAVIGASKYLKICDENQ